MDGLMKRDETGRDGWATGAIDIVPCWPAVVDWYMWIGGGLESVS